MTTLYTDGSTPAGQDDLNAAQTTLTQAEVDDWIENNAASLEAFIQAGNITISPGPSAGTVRIDFDDQATGVTAKALKVAAQLTQKWDAVRPDPGEAQWILSTEYAKSWAAEIQTALDLW